jgi:hypothetical protein
MILTRDHVTAASSIMETLDDLAERHDGASVVWLIQVLSAYAASSDGEIPVAVSAAQHVRMRRATDLFLGTHGAHDIDEVLTEVLLLEGA